MPHLHTTLGGEDSHLYKKVLQIIDNRHFIISVKGPVFPLTRVLISRQMWHLPSLPQIYFSVFAFSASLLRASLCNSIFRPVAGFLEGRASSILRYW